MNENVKRSAESILMLYAHFTLSLSQTSGASLTNCLSTIKINSPNVALKVYSEFLKKCGLSNTEYLRNITIFIIVVDGCIIIIHKAFTCDCTR